MDERYIPDVIWKKWDVLSEKDKHVLCFLQCCNRGYSIDENLHEKALAIVPEHKEDRMEWLRNNPDAGKFMEDATAVAVARMMDCDRYSLDEHLYHAIVEQYKQNERDNITSEVILVFMLMMAQDAGNQWVTVTQIIALYALSATSSYLFIGDIEDDMKSIFFPEK